MDREKSKLRLEGAMFKVGKVVRRHDVMQKNDFVSICGKWISFLVATCWFTTVLAISPSFEAEISGLSSLEPSNGRVHIDIAVNILSDPRFNKVVARSVSFEEGGLNILLGGQETDFNTQELNPPWEQALSLTLDNLPSGEYPLRLVIEDSVNDELLTLDSATITVPEERRAALPFMVSTWPPDPTVLDDIWLIVEPISFCSDLEGGLVISDAMIDDEPVSFEQIAIFENAGDCPLAGEQPMLKTLALPVMAFGGRTNLIYIRDDTIQTTSIDLSIEDRLSRRMAGSWYNPDESGHGITLEILDNGAVVFYWFTFDGQGNPAWIVAQGESEGTSVSLEAHLVSGGRFPPDFDANEIDVQGWGEISLSFSGCNDGHMSWTTKTPGFSDGDMALVRLSAPAGQPCQGPPPPFERVPDWYSGAGTYFAISSAETDD
ncbi:MAG: hypothetical protein U5L08_01410 [Xanthomonadales bacterium]|nr:hypothetical protein [Xanthomonadales bacterium]